MARRHVVARRSLAVVGVCTVVVAVPIGMAEAAAASQSPQSIISVTDCGDGLTITLGGTSVLGVGLPGDDCPTDSATPTPSICTLPPPPSTPPPSTPAPPPSHATTPAPTPTPVRSTPPPPSPSIVPQSVPTPPAPSSPTPKPTPVRTSPKPVASSPVMIVPSAQTFHTVPFKRLSTVLIVFIIAVVPAAIARVRHRRR